MLPGWITKNTGGAELQCYLLSDYLMKDGWNVNVITYYDNITKHHTSSYYNSRLNYFFVKKSNVRLITLLRLIRALLNMNVKYIYTRTNDPLMRGSIKLLKKKKGFKNIYALAGDDELDLEAAYQKKTSTKNLKKIIQKIDFYLIKLLTRNSPYKMDYIVTQTRFQQKKLKEKYNLDSTIIRNSYTSRNNSFNLTKKKNYILWVGNMRYAKNPEALVQIIESFKYASWKFIIIGDNHKYRDLFRKVKSKNYELLGELDYEETRKWFEVSKILINTSHSEGFSNTFIEAWLHCCIILSLKVDADGLLKNQNMGFHCENDITLLINTLNSVTSNISQYNEKLRSAKEFALKEFSFEKNYASFIQLIS